VPTGSLDIVHPSEISESYVATGAPRLGAAPMGLFGFFGWFLGRGFSFSRFGAFVVVLALPMLAFPILAAAILVVAGAILIGAFATFVGAGLVARTGSLIVLVGESGPHRPPHGDKAQSE